MYSETCYMYILIMPLYVHVCMLVQSILENHPVRIGERTISFVTFSYSMQSMRMQFRKYRIANSGKMQCESSKTNRGKFGEGHARASE